MVCFLLLNNNAISVGNSTYFINKWCEEHVKFCDRGAVGIAKQQTKKIRHETGFEEGSIAMNVSNGHYCISNCLH